MSGIRLTCVGWLGAVGLAVLLTGCHGTPSHSAEPCAAQLEPTPRGTTELDLSAVPSLGPPFRPALPTGRSYRALTAHQCQCLAAQNASVAEMLDDGNGGKHPDRDACLPGARRSQLIQRVQTLAAEEARNRAAGKALEAYYRLAEAEGRAELLTASQVEVNALLAVAEELHARKLVDRAEIDTVQRQSAELVADAFRLQIGIDQLNASLHVLLGLKDSCAEWSIWPADTLRVTPAEKSADEYVAFGLAHRPDLALLRTLDAGLNKSTLLVVRQFLVSVNPLLAMKTGEPLSTLWKGLKECLCGEELAKVRRQVAALLRERELQATEEIRQSAFEVELRLGLVSLAQQRVTAETRKVEEVKEKRARNLATEVDVRKATLDVVKARRDLLSEVVSWQLAASQLRQYLGVLAQECEGACGAEQ